MTVENLNITVKTNADKAAPKLESLASAIDKLEVSVSKMTGLSNLANLASAVAQLSTSKVSVSIFNSMAKGIERLSEALATITEGDIVNLTMISDALAKLNGVNLSGVAGAARVVGKETNKAANGIKEVGDAANKSEKPLGNFLSSLKRIAFYRFIRSIIKGIGQAFQEGLEKAYLFSAGISDAMGHRFAAAMDNMKSSTNAMKGQLGSAFIGLLTALEPVIIRIVDLVTRVADAISQFFAAFTGTTYLKANKTAAKFADTMKKGGAAAKEWKNQLLGFDEINRLNEPSSGGGGSSTNPLKGYKFEDAPINEKLLKFIDMLKGKLAPAVERVKEAFQRLKGAWDRFVESITSDKALNDLITDMFVLADSTLLNGITVLADALTLVLDVLTALNTGDWSHVWFDFKQLLYDTIVLIMDFFVGVTNSVMDVLISLAKVIDGLIGTDFAGWLQGDKDAFNEMYTASRDSEDGLFGLKRTLGLTQSSTEKLAEEADKLTVNLDGVGAKAVDLGADITDVRSDVDWLLQGFRDFGSEVGWIITSLFQPLADLCAWIDSALQGFGLLKGINARVDAATADGSIYLQGFASGGFPTEGQLFLANEGSAPEMVGTMGGRTAVATNADIVEGIREGVYDAVVAANGNGGRDVQVRVYLDSREIKAGQQRLNRAWGV